MHRLISIALRFRSLVLFATGLLIALGLYGLQRLPIDAVPDVTPNQVLVLTRARGLSPLEVEQSLTFPVETAMTGLPGIEKIQSVSKNGISYVAIYFREDMDIYMARRLVMERLPEAREAVPPGSGTPEMGPISTGLGEIYQFKVAGNASLMDLRSVLDWQIAPKLRTVPGIVEVNAHGGDLKTYEVQVDSDKLTGYHVPLETVIRALQQNNANAGGAYLERSEQQSVIRAEGLISNLSDIENIVIGSSGTGIPILIKNIADVRFAPMVRQGFSTQDGKGEVVVGVAMMLIGENSRAVAERVKAKLAEIQKTLPAGVRIVPYYDRTELVTRTIRTVSRNLIEGGLLVIAVLLLLLGTFKGGIMVSLAIPLSMLAAFAGMVLANVSGNLMSLGAIDFGLIVDGSVVMVENTLRKLSARGRDENVMDVIRDAGAEVARPVFFAVAIIVLVYIPILTLGGVEGKMFHPMAMTVLFAVTASLAIALMLMPALASIVFQNAQPGIAHDTWLMQRARKAYEPLLQRALRFPKTTVAISAAAFALSLIAVPFLGAEFMPRLDEGSILIEMFRLPGISMSESIHGNEVLEKVVKEFPEVSTVVSRTGSPEVATDPMPLDQSDEYVMLKPRDQWPAKLSKDDLIAAIRERITKEAPGAGYSFTQPIQMRMQELMETGSRSDVAVKIYGDDLDVLRETADRVAAILRGIKGAVDIKPERVAGLPYLRIRVRRDAIARHGLNVADVLDTVEAIGGKVVGQVVDGNRRYAVQVRFQQDERATADDIRNLKIGDNEGHFIPLSQLADVWDEEGPAQISRENAQRRISVECNVNGRDLAGFVSEAQRAIDKQIKLPAGYSMAWGGQFEQLQSASGRLVIAVPLALLIILALLYFNFGSLRPAALIFLNIPLAATGGILALLLRGMPFSITAAVGFIALFGIAVLNGVVLLTYISQLRHQGEELSLAVEHGSVTRLRPVLMTALVASLGFIPMAISTGAGAEVQRPLATVVIGGLITSTLLTLLVLPSAYLWIERWIERRRLTRKA